MAWPPGYGAPPPVAPMNPTYVPPQVYNTGPPTGWQQGGWPPAGQPAMTSAPPPSMGAWPPSTPMNTAAPSSPTSWGSRSNVYGTAPPGPPSGYPVPSTGTGYNPYVNSGGYSSTTSTYSPTSTYPNLPNNAPWPPAASSNTGLAPPSSGYGSPNMLNRNYSQPQQSMQSSIPSTYSTPSIGTGPPPMATGGGGYYPPSTTSVPVTGSGYRPPSTISPPPAFNLSANPYSSSFADSYSYNNAAAPSSSYFSGSSGSNPYTVPTSYQRPSIMPAPSSMGYNQMSNGTNTASIGPYGAPTVASTGTAMYSPKTGRANNVGVSPMQELLMKDHAEAMEREEAKKKSENEAAAKRAAIEALQRRESAESQRLTFLHQMEMDRIAKEAQEAQSDLERQQQAAMSVESQRQKEALLKLQKEREAIEAANRAAQRKRAHQEEQRLKDEQARLDQRQAALAAKERQLANAAQRAKQEEAEARLAREREMARQAEETEKLQQSFYGSVLEITKILATTNQRIVKLITLSYDDIVGGKPTPNGSPSASSASEQQFLKDLIDHIDKTSHQLCAMIKDNVLNVDDSLHSTISSSVSNLSSAISALIQYCNRMMSPQMDSEMASFSDQERQMNARKRASAVTFAIKSIVEVLEKMKIEESTTEGTKVLNAGSKEEATQNVEAQLQVQAGERSRIAAQLGLNLRKPLLITSTFDPSKVNLANYNLDKVCLLQRCIHHWATRFHFQQLVERITQSSAGTANAHRKKVLFEVLSTEASYFQTLDVIINYFYKPLSGAANKPNNGIITPEQVRTVFNSIEAIHAFSRKLLNEFDSRLQKWPAVQLFGDIFLDYADDMFVYSDYINGFDESAATLKKLLLNPKFVAFEQECMKATGKRLDLASLLIQPVQRMPRYGLLIKELLSHSSPDHIDYKNLEEAKVRIGEVCAAINRKKQEYDNKTALIRISSEIQGLPHALDPTKSLFIASEWLQLGGDHKHWTKAYLLSDQIIFGKCRSEKTPPPYQYCESFRLVDIGVVGRRGHKRSFLLWDKSGQKKLERTLHFSDEMTCARWLKDMKDAIETATLQEMLNDDIASNITSGPVKSSSSSSLSGHSSTGSLNLLCATYGDLTNPNATIDVTSVLQKIVASQGGKSLTLPASSKASIPGFVDPARSKKKSLIIVYTYGGPVKSRNFMDESPVQITN